MSQTFSGPAPGHSFANLELRGLTGEGRFSGYASLFGEVDLGKDVIERGAFQKSLASRGPSGVRMLFQHDPALPLGTWQVIREDARGLYVEGQLSPGVAKSQEVHQLMKNGALDGLSIGFQAVKSRADAKAGVRRILEADLWEISIVTFPMLPSARVAQVKHRNQTAGVADSRKALAARIRRAIRSLKTSL